jgi:hypothetical protein
MCRRIRPQTQESCYGYEEEVDQEACEEGSPGPQAVGPQDGEEEVVVVAALRAPHF